MNIPFKIPVSLKNRTVVGAVCIAVALIVGFVLVPIVSNSASASVTVVRAKQDIPVGTLIKKDMLDTVSVGKKGLSDNVLHDVNDVVGKYAAVVITAEDNISASKLSSTGSMYNLNDGQLLISVAVKSFADGLSGKIQAGDIVSVFYPPSQNTLSGTASTNKVDATCPPELQFVKVAAVSTATGNDTDEATVKKQASSSNTNDLPATVTLLVNARQAQILAGQENNAAHLALACRGDSGIADQLLTKQADFFKQNLSSQNSSSSQSTSSQNASIPSSGSSSQPAQDNTSSNFSTSSLDNSASLGVVQ